MCNPVALAWAAFGVAAVGTVIQMKQQNAAIEKQAQALSIQNSYKQEEIADQAGNEINERARAARRERAAARVSASESGINLGSNSFLAMLQSSEINESIDSGLILRNERIQQRSRQAEYNSNLATLTKHTGLGIALGAVQSGVSAYYGAGGKSYFGRQPGRG